MPITIIDDDPPIDIDIQSDIDDEITTLGNHLIHSILPNPNSPSTCLPLAQIKEIVEAGAPLWYQDSEEGLSALHAAAYRQDPELIEYLIAKGAVWNLVDNLGNTAGDVSYSYNDAKSYEIIRNAGLRSEYLLAHLSSKGAQLEAPSALILRNEDPSAAGSSHVFLSSSLKFTKDEHGQDVCLVQSGDEAVGVMMGWERPIMQESVDKLCLSHPNLHQGLKVLNVGFGLGIIDAMFQSLPSPLSHHYIIEAHPDVLAYMREQGWYNKPNVTILEGRWQDHIESEELLKVGGFDVVYTDTFSETYKDLHAFFEHLPDLMDGPDARFSFFNGLGATNYLFYDVYTQLSELHLSNIGMSVSWSTVDLDPDNEEQTSTDRWTNTRVYFNQRFYRLPIGRMSM